MRNALLILCAALVLMPIGATAQDDQATTPKPGQDPTTQLAIPPPKGPPAPSDRFVRTLTNVQVELTLTDQLGNAAPEKKTVSMIVAERQLGEDSQHGGAKRTRPDRLECRCASVRVG